MNFGDIFTILLTQPLTNILVAYYQGLQFLNIPFALGISIILVTISLRFVLFPLTSSQIKASRKMQDIAPDIAKVKEDHKGDKKKQQAAMMKLYKENGVNPAKGCLPVIVQMPIIWGLYRVLLNVVNIDTVDKIGEINRLMYFPSLNLNTLWNTTLFGLQLSASPSSQFTSNPAIIVVPLLTAFFQLILSKMMMPEKKIDSKKNDFQTTFMKQTLMIFPVMVGVFSFSLPLGLSLYWNAFTIFGIFQQQYLVGQGGLKLWTDKLASFRS